MPRYENSPANDSASLLVFPKDDYPFIVGEPKPFHGETKSGPNKGKENYGVVIALTVKGGEFDGKRMIKRLFEHNQESRDVGKQFKMAVLGYGKGRSEEERFNADWGSKDWSFDTDAGTVGDAWREMTGQVVIGMLETKMDDTDTERQVEKGWRPLNDPTSK